MACAFGVGKFARSDSGTTGIFFRVKAKVTTKDSRSHQPIGESTLRGIGEAFAPSSILL
jgi:hypothetical protein